MKIIKRSGSEVNFDIQKIIDAIKGANSEVKEAERLTDRQVVYAAQNVADRCESAGHTVSVEEIQDMVEDEIMALDRFEVARRYIIYRYVQGLKRQKNTTDDKILSLIECNNEEVKQENSNKNPTVNSVQRDYMAGEVSKDLTQRVLLPAEIVEAHNEGIIHFHDSDYFAQHMHNCDLVNLEDMLQNGTVISGTLIERPHSFSTACNIATQIIAQVASCQYGGQSISLTHLAPFVEVSRQKIRRQVDAELKELGIDLAADLLTAHLDERGEVRERDGLPAVLAGSDLGDDLRGDVACRAEAVGALDERAGDDRAVLKHVLEVHEVAVVHVLGKVIGVVEVNDALVVGLHDLGRKQDALGEVLGDLAGHVVALHGVDGGVLVGVLLLDLFVVALDQGQDLVVRGVLLTLEALNVPVDDVAPRDLEAVEGHDLILDHVLDLLNGDGMTRGLAAVGDVLGGIDHLALGEALAVLDLAVGAVDGVDDLLKVEGDLRTAALDDLHCSPPWTRRA